MTGVKVFVILSLLYPGESIWEEHARAPVESHNDCRAVIRAFHAPIDSQGLSFALSCFDELAPEDNGNNEMRAGYSLEKTLPKGEHAASKPAGQGKGGKQGQGAAGGVTITPFNGSP